MTSRQKRARRLAGLPVELPKVPDPPRSSLCADSADGCYMFGPGTPERDECRAACRMLRRDERVKVVGNRFALLAALFPSPRGGSR